GTQPSAFHNFRKTAKSYPEYAAAYAIAGRGYIQGKRSHAHNAVGNTASGTQGTVPTATGAGGREGPRFQSYCGPDTGIYCAALCRKADPDRNRQTVLYQSVLSE